MKPTLTLLTALLLTPLAVLHAADAVSQTQPGLSSEDRDLALFDALDLGREDLREVKAALDRSDLAAAKAALVTHFRSRTKPIGPALSPDGSARGRRAADEICDHVFRLAGCPPTKLEREIRWNEDPHNYDQWPIALNRHAHWVTLGRAYAATKDEKYAREFVAQLDSWVRAMPVRIGRNYLEGPFLRKDSPHCRSTPASAWRRRGGRPTTTSRTRRHLPWNRSSGCCAPSSIMRTT